VCDCLARPGERGIDAGLLAADAERLERSLSGFPWRG
jgi:hypothetical protein